MPVQHSQTLFSGSPDDIAEMINKTLAPVVTQMAEVHKRVLPLPSLLSIVRIAEDCSCGRETVRRWIVEGRKLPGKDKTIKLKVVSGLTDGLHLVRREDYEDFLDQFPSIRL